MGQVIKVTGAAVLSRSRLISLIRRLEQYEAWKRAVFIRDRFTCQQCGRRNGRRRIIEAHHVVELSLLVKTHGIKTVDEAINCPELWLISNGQTLCRGCHEQTESYPVRLRKNKTSPHNGKATH